MRAFFKIGIIAIAVLFCLTSFSKKKRKAFVTLKCLQDTIYMRKPFKDSQRGRFVIEFNLTVRNVSNKPIDIHETHLMIGYDNDYADYHLEIYRKVDGKMIPSKFTRVLHTTTEYPGVHVNLQPGKEAIYEGSSGIYQMTEAGKYYIKAVMDDHYEFMGESNIDSLIVIDTFSRS